MFIASSLRRIAAGALSCALVAVLLAGSLSPAASEARDGAPALAQGLPSAAATPAAGPLSEVPSTTQPYAACPRPKRRHAACQAVIVPPAAQLASLALAASPASGGIEGSGLTPAELQSAYKLPSSSAGSGQTVALVDAFDDPTAEADLATYRSAYGLPACTGASGCFRKVSQTGGTNYPAEPTSEDGDWNLEESLDVDMVSAICPNCHILLVEAEHEQIRRPDDGRERGGGPRCNRGQQQLGGHRLRRRDRIRRRLRSPGNPDHGGERRLGL